MAVRVARNRGSSWSGLAKPTVVKSGLLWTVNVILERARSHLLLDKVEKLCLLTEMVLSRFIIPEDEGEVRTL